MFTAHFNMTHHPFAENPPIDWLLKDERIAQALARLDYLASDGLLALILGQTGVGKSSLLRLFIAALSKNLYHPIYMHLTHLNAASLLRLIVTELGEQPRLGKDRLFKQILQRAHKAEPTTLLLIDEAHLLEPEALTDLRLLLSSPIDEHPKLKMVLCGQETLRSLLTREAHAGLANRISVRAHLHPLTKDQTTAYIDQRIKHSGATPKLFEPEAKNLIHEYAAGIPRQINNIATAALIHAQGHNQNKITQDTVNHAMAEFRMP